MWLANFKVLYFVYKPFNTLSLHIENACHKYQHGWLEFIYLLPIYIFMSTCCSSSGYFFPKIITAEML